MRERQRPRPPDRIAKDQDATAVHAQSLVHHPDVLVHCVRVERSQIDHKVAILLFALLERSLDVLEEQETGGDLVGPELGAQTTDVRFVFVFADLDETVEAGLDESANGQGAKEVLVLVDEVGRVAFEFVAGAGLEVAVGGYAGREKG